MYSQPITHLNRGAIVFVIDCSMSMQERTFLNNVPMTKIEAVTTLCNYLIDELMWRATRHGEVRNYYDIAVIGYHGDTVESMLPIATHDNFVTITRLAEQTPTQRSRCFEQKTEKGYTVDNSFTLREWIKPEADGLTPMFQALSVVYSMVDKWCSKPENRLSFPPIIFHITDGECNDASDTELIEIANSIRKTSTEDGETLLMNIHLSPYADIPSEIFPTDGVPTTQSAHYATLFHMSSIMPDKLSALISTIAKPAGSGPYRGFAFNASPCDLLTILNIGSESINLA